jgi:Zn-dependent peptidase ImmA (M78 family)
MDTVHSMQRRQAWMREFMMDEGRDPLTFVGSAREVDSIGSIAQKMREVLELDDTWASKEKTWRDALNTLRGAIETAGILIVVNGVVGNNTHRALDVEEFRGFVLVDEFAPLVFVNGSDSKAAQMFTLGHELAHVFLGSSAAFDLRGLMPSQESTEVKCNKVAAEFLVPEARLRGLWQSIGHLDDPFQAAARRFKVSELVVARRALDLGLISRTEFFDFYNMRQAFYRDLKSKKSSGGDYYNNLNVRVGKRFASAVIRATREGKLLYSEAYRLTDMHGRAFDNYAAKIGLGGL